MVAPRDWAEVVAQNRRAWEEVADVRVRRWSNRAYTADFLVDADQDRHIPVGRVGPTASVRIRPVCLVVLRESVVRW